MSRSAWSLLRTLTRRLPADGEPLADADLLRRFADNRDQAAFEVLVWRHGGMVLGVCRRLLRDEHAAEDAFQATFLILARKAGSVRGNVAGWLHRVARRVAIRASKRTKHERLAADPPGRPTTSPDPEVVAILDAEIDRLPDRFRLPVVLCYLNGRRTEDAAELLGIPRGTVLSRLATARQTLAARLTRRGMTLPAGGLAATVTAEQVTASVTAADRFVAGGLTGGTVQLANEVLHMSVRKQVIGWAAVLVATAGLGTGVMVGASDSSKMEPASNTVAAAGNQKPPISKPKPDEPPASEQEAARKQQELELRKRKIALLSTVVEKEISNAEGALAKLREEAAFEVDLSALQAAIAQVDTKFMDCEDEIARLPAVIAGGEGAIREVANNVRKRMEELRHRRIRLAQRIANKQSIVNKMHTVEDDLKVYRELRQSLIRHRILLELGDYLRTDAATGHPEIGDHLLTELRKTIQTEDGKNRFDVLQQRLDELRQEIRRLADKRK